MRVVLDTNIFVSGIFWNGPPSEVLHLWANRKFDLTVSEKIINEYFRVLSSLDKDSGLASQWLLFVLKNAHIVPSRNLIQKSRDASDDIFLNCAVVGNASYIVSGDNDLLSLKKIQGIPILSPRMFLSLFQQRDKAPE